MSFIQSPGGVAVLVYLFAIAALFACHIKSKIRKGLVEKKKRVGLSRQLAAEIECYDPVVIDRVGYNDSVATKLAVISRLEKETDRRISRLSKKIAACEAQLDASHENNAARRQSVDTVLDNGKPPPLDFSKLAR